MLSDEQFAALEAQNRAAHEKQAEILRNLSATLLTMEIRLAAAEAKAEAEEAEEKASKKSHERQRMWRSAVLAILQGGYDCRSESVNGDLEDDPIAEAAAIARFADAIVAEDDKRVP